MVVLAIASALVALVGILAIPFLPTPRRSSYERPAAFTFTSAAPLAALVNPAATPAATQPLPVITGMDQVVGQAMPDVFIDVGIWCN